MQKRRKLIPSIPSYISCLLWNMLNHSLYFSSHIECLYHYFCTFLILAWPNLQRVSPDCFLLTSYDHSRPRILRHATRATRATHATRHWRFKLATTSWSTVLKPLVGTVADESWTRHPWFENATWKLDPHLPLRRGSPKRSRLGHGTFHDWGIRMKVLWQVLVSIRITSIFSIPLGIVQKMAIENPNHFCWSKCDIFWP